MIRKLIFLGSIFISSISYAQTASDLLAQAEGMYMDRYAEPTVDVALTLLAQASSINAGSDLLTEYKIQVLSSRYSYAKARLQSEKDKILTNYEAAMNAADVAKEIGLLDLPEELADAYYYHGIALARWAETKGITESLSRRKELMADMETTMTLTTLSGVSGEMIDSYGPNRVLGRLYFKLPGIFGGSKKKALENLRLAVANGQEYALNVLYLAEVLIDGNSSEEAEGCQMLADLLSRDPSTFDPAKPQETKEELASASEMQAKECK